MDLGKTLGKNVVLAGNCDGFIGNRMLQYYTGEAECLMEQGATPEQIDRVAEKFGMPMGPISMRDMSGLDIGVLVRKERLKTLPPGECFSPILERLVEQGRCGMKTGKGFYRYEGRDKSPDLETTQIIEDVANELGIERRTFTDEEIEFRLFAPLVNEGPRRSKTVRRCAPAISMSPGSTDTVFLRTGAGRCSGVSRWDWTRSTTRRWRRRNGTAHAGHLASFWSDWRRKAKGGRTPEGARCHLHEKRR